MASSITPLRGSRDKAEQHAEDQADADRDNADQNRHAGAGQQLRDDVAPEQSVPSQCCSDGSSNL